MRVIFGITVFLAAQAIAEPMPAVVDSSLNTVVSTGYHRFLEYRVCSPEHCWSKSYLQWFDLSSSDREIRETVVLPEIGYGKAVVSATWVWDEQSVHLEVAIVPSHGGFEPYTLVITPGDPGQYEAVKK